MKNLFYSKNLIVLLVILTITPIYLYLLSFDPFGLGDQPIDVIIYLLFALLIVYLIYILTSILEFLILKTTRLVKVNDIIVFPFTFDGEFRFAPFKLLSSQLYLQGYTVINLANDLKNGANENELKKKLKGILYVRIIATTAAYLVMILLLNSVFNIFILTALLISFIAEVLLSYTTDQRNWRGTGYLLRHGNIEHYLYTLPNLGVFSAEDYAHYIDRTIGNVEKQDDYSYVQIFENEMYASIYEEKQSWEIDRLKLYCKTILATTYSANWSTITHEARKMGLKKCLGLYALLLNDDQIKQLAKDILEKEIIAVKETSSARHTESFLRFLNGEKEEIKPSEHFMVGMNNYFSHRHRIEQKIIELVKY